MAMRRGSLVRASSGGMPAPVAAARVEAAEFWGRGRTTSTVPPRTHRYARGVDLTGPWRVRRADDHLRRHGIGLDVIDDDWHETSLPGHWAADPALGSEPGPLLYRRRFTMSAPPTGCRRWVVIDGVIAQADVHFDGAYLGDPEGHAVPHAYDITALSHLGDDHVLAIEVSCPPVDMSRPRSDLTGTLQGVSSAQPSTPGGLIGGVHIEDTGPVRLDRLRVLTRDADDSRAHLLLRSRLDTDQGRTVIIRTSVGGIAVDELSVALAAGVNDVAWSLDLEQPRLWWPHRMGAAELVDIGVEVVVDNVVSHSAQRRTGVREVAWDDWVCSINGERLHLKGTNLLPLGPFIANVDDALCDEQVRAMVEVGLDVVRVNAHLAPSSVYDAADRRGLLVMQDFWMVGPQSRQIRPRAVAAARDMVDALAHHPSIISWSAHDEPDGPWDDSANPAMARYPILTRARRLARQQLPSWNRTVLDRTVRRTITEADPTRRCTPHSGVLPTWPTLRGTDSHLGLGWSEGPIDDLARASASFPGLFRFVSHFGTPVPPVEPCDDDTLAGILGVAQLHFDDHVPAARHSDHRSWREATLAHQAEVVTRYIEHLRRIRYRPNGGFCVASWRDPVDGHGWGLHDHTGAARPALDALRAVCAPVIVVADRLQLGLRPGTSPSIDVHVVNDLRIPIVSAHADICISTPTGVQRHRVSGAIDADTCERITSVEVTVPDVFGEVTTHVALTATDDHGITHRSEFVDRVAIDVNL